MLERDLTSSELERANALPDEVAEADAAVKRADAEQERIGAISRPGPDPEVRTTAGRGDRLASVFADQVGQMASGSASVKSVLPASGSVSVPVDLGELVLDPYGRQGLAALLAQGRLATGDQFSYLRQTSREQNAAVVPTGTQKPTSKYELTRVTSPVVTLAHLSEAIPKQWLSDINQLQEFVTNELSSGLQQALGNFVLTGDDAAEVPGVLTTSGVGQQPYGDDLLGTCRSAITALQRAGETPTGWVFAPEDWEKVEAQRDDANRYLYQGPPQQPAGQQLFGIRVEIDVNVPQGQALLADWTTVQILSRQPTTVDWSEAGELFERNMVKFRAENRVGLAVKRPNAVRVVELAAG